MSSKNKNDREELLRRNYAEIAQLAGGLAHEIRNPLSTISLNLGVLSEDLEDGDTPRDLRMKRRIEIISRECDHLEQILSDFLRFTTGMELETQLCDLSQLVGSFIESQRLEADARQIEISPHLAPDLPRVHLDPHQFRQVLLNLTLNAMQAMPEGGVLEFQTFLQANEVVLQIIDNGDGISKPAQKKIFDLFYSSKPEGSGLGLPTVRKIIEAHHGSIQCESEPGRGTKFTVFLPISQDSQEK